MEPDTGNGTGPPVEELLHPIGEAARLTGVSRGVLRLWERERLISPKRTPGGHRLYSGGDLRRLRQIARLRRMDRLNVAAIRRELGATDGADPAGAPASEPGLGARLRALRTAAGRSLAEVATASGLSVSFLSAVERGQANPSVGNLFKLADAYGTTVPGLDPNYRSERRSVLHPRDRPRYVAGRGLVVIEDLLASPGALEAQRIEVRPGGGSEEAYAHPGEEFVYILSGQLVFWLDERERFALDAGDSLSFRSTRPHRWRNDGDVPATVLWINVPVVEPAPDGAGRRSRAGRRPDLRASNPDGGED
jgi:DNA-binding transcriptional MerR regulator/quercetin dioxygenase-like cupin family protein